ncbi:hypothetical protein GCM10020220_089990 [Nonomuraea rubra]
MTPVTSRLRVEHQGVVALAQVLPRIEACPPPPSLKLVSLGRYARLTAETSARITPRTTCNPTAPALVTYTTVCS